MFFSRSKILLATFMVSATALVVPASAGTLGRGMQQLVRLQEKEKGQPAVNRALRYHITSPRGEVLVDVHLQKGVSTKKALAQLAKSGFRLTAVSKMNPRLIEGYLRLDSARNAAQIPGVRTILAVQKPRRNAGAVQSQAVAVQKADLAQARGVDGTGIKVGALSDSYASVTDSPNADDDVASGDLPEGVVVLEDLPVGDGADEGRAMLQLIHDVAPGSKLAFATAFNGLVDFSNNILALRSDFGADVITDDVIYFAEPMFSDGLLAQTVDQVVANGAAYFSSAGNNGLEGYRASFAEVSFAKAQQRVAEGKENLDLAALTAAGYTPKSFHKFKKADGTDSISQNFTSFFGDVFDFQWDEPFDVGKVKTDYDVFLFDAAGHFIDPNDPNSPAFYTTDDNVATDEAVELAFVNPGTYQIVIAKMNDGDARRIRYVDINGAGESEIQNSPTLWGHAAARNGQAVAAMFYGITNFPEDFSAPGPTRILFDADGNRLAEPEIRKTPQITGVDGVDTTFFGFDIEGNGLPNFFGTSAAAPDVAAVAALVLQSAGGPGSMAPAAVYSKLQKTATPMPLAKNRQLATASAGVVMMTANGDFPRVTDYWRLWIDPAASHTVSTISINLTSVNMLWSNPTGGTGFFVGQTKGINPGDVTVSRSDDRTTLTLTFAAGTFGAGDLLTFSNFAFPIQLPVQFEVDADRVAGALVTVTFDDDSQATGTFMTGPLLKINHFTGAGLVNADAATR
jgi:hypothetical protein